MNVLTVHYHLRPGGVTEVIRQNHRILTAAGINHEILCGDNPSELPAAVDPAFDYSSSAAATGFPGSRLPDHEGLLHFHNPCLGKNPALTASLASLANSGRALLLQHHDFAEDGRPELLAALRKIENPYPLAPRIGHAFINTRDREIFLRAGLPEDRAFLLPNPFSPRPLPPVATHGPAVVLHPMRGLPRKNLGEMLLLAACSPPGTRFLQGSAPANETWRENYEGWRRFAAELGLPIDFDVFPHGRDDALARSTHLLTTSTQEGFGMIHLEAAGHRRVLGRRIAHLAADLAGFPADGLYDALLVAGTDFAALGVDDQRRAISSVVSGKLIPTVIHGEHRTSLPAWLADQLSLRPPGDASAALARHGDAAHLGRLLHIARTLLDAPAGPVTALDPRKIAEAWARHEKSA